MSVKLFAAVFFVFGILQLRAQEVITTAGGNATGSGGSVSFTIGQIVYKTDSGAQGSVSQGVQQPYEISAVSISEDYTGIGLILSCYPNPTTGFLVLKVEDYHSENLQYKLFDADGRLLINSGIMSPESFISLESYPSGTYFLKVNKQLTEIQSLKIIKK